MTEIGPAMLLLGIPAIMVIYMYFDFRCNLLNKNFLNIIIIVVFLIHVPCTHILVNEKR